MKNSFFFWEPASLTKLRKILFFFLSNILLMLKILNSVCVQFFVHQQKKPFSRIHSKPINIRWIGTGSRPCEKTMSSVVLYLVFYDYTKYNYKIKTIFFCLKRPKARAKETGFNLIIVRFISAERCL